MAMEKKDVRDLLEEAELVLVGLGEDFDDVRTLNKSDEYKKGRTLLEEANLHWLIPVWMEYCRVRIGDDAVRKSLHKLATMLQDKNYFIVATSTNRTITEIPWKSSRLVMPCGSTVKKQCAKGCSAELEKLTAEESERLYVAFEQLFRGELPETGFPDLGRCKECNGDMICNTIYAESYNEAGYLDEWQIYMKWLQGTLNRKLVILELGVGMRFPSIIRWPFEKVAFFNQKASFYRINERLFHMTEELGAKGIGIAQNAIDWINQL